MDRRELTEVEDVRLCLDSACACVYVRALSTPIYTGIYRRTLLSPSANLALLPKPGGYMR